MSKLKKIRQKVQNILDEIKRRDIPCKTDIPLIEGLLKDNDYDEALTMNILMGIYHDEQISKQELQKLHSQYCDIESSTIDSIFLLNGHDVSKTAQSLQNLQDSKMKIPSNLKQKFPTIEESVLLEVYLANDSNLESTEIALHHMLFTSHDSNEVYVQICQMFSTLLTNEDFDTIFTYISSFDSTIDVIELIQFTFNLMNEKYDGYHLISEGSMADSQMSTHQDLCLLQLQYHLESHGLQIDEKILMDVLNDFDYDIDKAYLSITSQKLNSTVTYAEVVKQNNDQEAKVASNSPKDDHKLDNSDESCNRWESVGRKAKPLKRSECSSIPSDMFNKEHALRMQANKNFIQMKECFKTATLLQRCCNCTIQAQEAIQKGQAYRMSMNQANAEAAYHAIR